MDAREIRRLKPELSRYLQRLARVRWHLREKKLGIDRVPSPRRRECTRVWRGQQSQWLNVEFARKVDPGF